MTEQDIPTPEQVASPEQAQAVLDEVTRITAAAELQTHTDDGHAITPLKEHYRGNLTVFLYPAGAVSAADPDRLTLAAVNHRQLDSSEHIFDVVQSLEGMRLTKRVLASPYRRQVPGVDLERLAAESEAEREGDIDEIDVLAASIARNLVSLEQDQKGWAVERALGMDQASHQDADDLLALLTGTSAAI